MDGFRERLSGRYDRLSTRGSGYERMPSDDRFEGDRFERSPRRGAAEGVSQEAITEGAQALAVKGKIPGAVSGRLRALLRDLHFGDLRVRPSLFPAEKSAYFLSDLCKNTVSHTALSFQT